MYHSYGGRSSLLKVDGIQDAHRRLMERLGCMARAWESVKTDRRAVKKWWAVCFVLAALICAAAMEGASSQSSVRTGFTKPYATDQQQCPSVRIDGCPGSAVTSGTIVSLTAVVENQPQGFSPTYSWTFKDRRRDRSGRISPLDNEGRCTTGTANTDKVCIDTGGLRGDHTATVTIGGWPAGCNTSNSAACTFNILEGQPLVARLNNIATELQNHPGGGVYIICYGGRNSRPDAAQRHCEFIKDFLVNSRDIDAGRIVIVDGGYRESLTEELWILPAGATPPNPSPTVHPSEVEAPPAPRRARRRGSRRPQNFVRGSTRTLSQRK